MPVCIGKENNSDLIRLADFFPDPDMSFWGICKFRSWFYFPSPGGNQQAVYTHLVSYQSNFLHLPVSTSSTPFSNSPSNIRY